MQKFFPKQLARLKLPSCFCLSLSVLFFLNACAATPTPNLSPTNAPAFTAIQTISNFAPTIQPTDETFPRNVSTPTTRPTDETFSRNVSTPTLQPSNHPTTQLPNHPTPAPDLAPGVISYESSVTIDVYPYEKFWSDKRDPATNIPFKAFDRAAYDASSPRPTPETFRVIVIANEYLKLTFLPELGGRLYQALHIQSGKTMFYNNPVLKPSPWGMSVQGGWLAAGGIEWAFPTQEHGYEWNAVWDAQVTRAQDGVSVTLTDSNATDRPRAKVRVTLPPRATYFKIELRVENPTASPQRIQFWLNAMLNLSSEKISPDTEFIFPTDSVFIHSTANEWMPRERVPSGDATAPLAPISFSNAQGRDLRFFRNWDQYLGVFAVETGTGNLAQNFVGAYNHETNFGVARVFATAHAPGVKLFAFGPNFCCRDAYTDDGSDYFELWGGIPRTFFPDDDITLAPGEARAWTEYWLPLPRTNGLSAASSDAALYVQRDADQVYLNVYSAIARDAVIVLKQGDTNLNRWQETFSPGRVWEQRVKLENTNLQLQLQDANGDVIVETR